MTTIYVAGSGDTKWDELVYIKQIIESHGLDAILVDLGTSGHVSSGDITPSEVASYHPDGAEAVKSDDRGTAVAAMATAFEYYTGAHLDAIDGMIGAGGSGGTALVTPAMRRLPVGVPKIMVSTVASANVAPYVGPADIAMMYSVTDVAGLNRISRQVLGNAANAIAGMAANRPPEAADDLPAVGLTMFGVTTPLVTSLVEQLNDRYEPLVFHATGTGGKSMEKLVDSGMVEAVLDMTTTEVADLVVGGVFPAGPDRFGSVIRTQTPFVGSTGALDMVNFGAIDTVPSQFADRNLYVHNPQVTLMRTTPDENVDFAKFIASKLNQCEGPVRFLLPEGGVSMIDAPGQPFHDPVADEALFETLEAEFRPADNRRLVRVPHNINDDGFVEATMVAFGEVTKGAE
ncbi:MAG: Tm-1-like ATP-binding domain-containing protein [Acidimicrobiia bacterium]